MSRSPATAHYAITVLVADDSEPIREILCSILEREGWTPIQAADGEAALEQARQHHPDLLLLDVMMPGKGGYQVCEELRREPIYDDMPIIFLSGESQSRDRIEGLSRGAADYVCKPFDPDEVVARVRNHLAIQRRARELRADNRHLRETQARLEKDLRAAVAISRRHA